MKPRLLLIIACLFVLIAASIVGASLAIVHAQQSSHPPTHRAATDGDGENDQEAVRSNPLSSTGSCGVERWSVKTGTDADAGSINLQSITSTTIASLTSLPAPSTLPANNRVKPTETTVFQLHDTLTEFKLESDSDYHLVLQDTSGKTMISEIPDPACVGSSSPLLSDIQRARAEFDARFTVTTSFQTVNIPVTVTGVGFFDFLHGQTGVAPNGIELHAVLDIQFSGSGTPTPTPSSTPLPTPTPTGTPTGTNLIQNGGFETSGSWTFTGQTLPVITTTRAHSGSFSLRVGTTSGQQGDSVASQFVTIPASTSSATLSFFYWPTTNDSLSFAWQEVDIVNSNGQVLQQLFRKLTNDRTWIQQTFDLSAYAGQTIGLQFLDHEQSNGGS
ncbi:MAG TPA: hypothetical protein VFV38_21870, partial [Ktedonobacteraceae bacterium]|nr:hypothetical protein [Ktedonobacteraceae bacterium]